MSKNHGASTNRLVRKRGLWLLWLPGIGWTQDRSLAQVAAQAKLAPPLLMTAAPSVSQSYRVSVQSAAEFSNWMRREFPAVSVSQHAAPGGIHALSGVNAPQLAKLLACAWVTFVNVPSWEAHEERPLDNSDLIVNSIAPLHARFPSLAGQGMTVSGKERAFDPADIDFRGRVITTEATAQAVSAHATAMATLIAGGGNSAPSGKGAAWQARLMSADFSELLPDDGGRLMQAGMSIQNHSYGVEFNSRGPAYDGRVKLELVADGADGSSDAAALVSGVSLLV